MSDPKVSQPEETRSRKFSASRIELHPSVAWKASFIPGPVNKLFSKGVRTKGWFHERSFAAKAPSHSSAPGVVPINKSSSSSVEITPAVGSVPLLT